MAGEFIILPSAKFPYLLSAKHPFTKLLVYVTHEGLHHTGVNGTITAIWQMLWVPTIKMYVRNRPEYAASIWSLHTCCDMYKVEMVQCRDARFIMNNYTQTAIVTDMLSKLNLKWDNK